MSLRILLSGASGRMGQQLEALAEQDTELEIVGRADQRHSFSSEADGHVIIDFSQPALCQQSLSFALANRVPIVIGTTGLDAELEAQIVAASEQIPICKAANFRIGIEVLRSVVQRISG